LTLYIAQQIKKPKTWTFEVFKGFLRIILAVDRRSCC